MTTKTAETPQVEDQEADKPEATAAPVEEDTSPRIELPGLEDESYTEDDLRLLSEEERAALFETDEDDEAESEDPEPAPAEAAEAAEDAPDDAGETVQPDEDVRGTLIENPATYDKQIDALQQARKDALAAWRDDGDMTDEEYEAKDAELLQSIQEVTSKKAVAEYESSKIYDNFMATARQYFKDVPELQTEAHIERFDAHVQNVTSQPQYQSLSHRQILEAAHRLYAVEAAVFGMDVPPVPGDAKPAPKQEDTQTNAQAPQEPAKPQVRKRPGDNAPKTLAFVPGDAPVSAADGKYASLAQRLENAGPEEYERIMSSLPPEEAEAFASMDV
ncbi:hypothetical protein RAZWK3B_16715 [Roseobacter sp. AzwK-3b]|uniref:hypothetical protein n=1 Tax=Roseobacter sp. AzwK-3b TaxID=351016 RepID=UPI00015699B1|nr:hypothetical protein [Roseobacter sp. AzwK-3b]EDM71058.1 hypothetical protein RAZWK3B_16715 [Roseobacter sp. AzwK-3b]